MGIAQPDHPQPSSSLQVSRRLVIQCQMSSSVLLWGMAGERWGGGRQVQGQAGFVSAPSYEGFGC